jgi:NhaP-type Na+/H+ or K+/H+ antiporter
VRLLDITPTKIFVSIGLGYGIAYLGQVMGWGYFNLNTINHLSLEHFLYALLVLGLYGSVYDIDIKAMKENKKIFIMAITLGIVFKVIFVSIIFYLISGNILAFLFGTILCPIDPLAVTALLKKNTRMFSDQARSLLRSWSSFDDPIITVIAIYLIFPFILSQMAIDEYQFKITDYFRGMGLNIGFALLTFLINQWSKKFAFLQYILLGITLIIAVYYKLTLGIAIIGLFLRPNLKDYLSKTIAVCYYLVALLLGFLLIQGFDIFAGFIL